MNHVLLYLSREYICMPTLMVYDCCIIWVTPPVAYAPSRGKGFASTCSVCYLVILDRFASGHK